MSALTVAASVTRPILGGGDLNLNDGTTYQIVTAGPGSRQWVRDLATAPSVHGAVPVSERMDLQTMTWIIRVIGTSAASLQTRSQQLVNAFSQRHYHVILTINGQTDEWACYAANIQPSDDGTYDKYRLAAFRQVYVMQIPRQPVKVSGVM